MRGNILEYITCTVLFFSLTLLGPKNVVQVSVSSIVGCLTLTLLWLCFSPTKSSTLHQHCFRSLYRSRWSFQFGRQVWCQDFFLKNKSCSWSFLHRPPIIICLTVVHVHSGYLFEEHDWPVLAGQGAISGKSGFPLQYSRKWPPADQKPHCGGHHPLSGDHTVRSFSPCKRQCYFLTRSWEKAKTETISP